MNEAKESTKYFLEGINEGGFSRCPAVGAKHKHYDSVIVFLFAKINTWLRILQDKNEAY